MQSTTPPNPRTEEERFLAAYNMQDYDRPSVATDIVAFTMYGEKTDSHRKDDETKLSVLLIRRGEHPFLNHWALPGGFLRNDETVEECACREIREETNLTPTSLISIGVFSEPGRDPRGRILSNAYLSVLCDDNQKPTGGNDALSAKWFDVHFDKTGPGEFALTLTADGEEITATLLRKVNPLKPIDFDILSNSGLAFDHAKIIATAFVVMRNEAQKPETAFAFLPEKFTLTALQRVQETMTGETLLPANFRRKIAGYVEETEEYTEGAGHRPAKLFKRKSTL